MSKLLKSYEKNIINKFFMKISLFTNGIYPYVLGGMQKHSYNLAKYFAKYIAMLIFIIVLNTINQ